MTAIEEQCTAINRCHVLDGLAALHERVTASGAATATVAYDTSLAEHPGLIFLREMISSSTIDMTTLGVDRMGGIADARLIARELPETEWVIAFGGGSLIDSVKLATALSDPVTARIVSAKQRSGWLLGPDRARPTVLAAVPTTIGTAAEVSGISSFTDGAVKRAFTSLALQPDFAVLDARATAGMPHEVLVEGCLEIILRYLGPVIGAEGPLGTTDRAALRLAAAAATELARIHRAGGADPVARRRLARLSITSHDDTLVRGRAPFTAKAWFLANNLSHHLGVRKMRVLANLIPAYWGHLRAAPGLGSADRARQAWEVLRAAIPVPVSAEPATGFAQWIDALGIPPLAGFGDEDVKRVQRSCVRMWGGGLPMLAGVGPDDIRAVLRRVRTVSIPAAQRSSRNDAVSVDR
ncbi:daptide-type RiPP biosynthesis dehydogenase [Streptomyces sp. NPDC058284]|uniref:daptide-type RiPP biosynthesis dehydogenase n=1 Tax=unclassified Streptomyces TaxID=2593676 RepID=UPI003658C180